jgi:hypothetical protein
MFPTRRDGELTLATQTVGDVTALGAAGSIVRNIRQKTFTGRSFCLCLASWAQVVARVIFSEIAKYPKLKCLSSEWVKQGSGRDSIRTFDAIRT